MYTGYNYICRMEGSFPSFRNKLLEKSKNAVYWAPSRADILSITYQRQNSSSEILLVENVFTEKLNIIVKSIPSSLRSKSKI